MAAMAAPRSFAFRGAALLVALAGMTLVSTWASGCLLTNINADDCSAEACQEIFGLGSSCKEGYCTDASACVTGHDCRRVHDGGACVDGMCRNEFPIGPLDETGTPVCNVFEPADLNTKPLTGPEAPIIVGGMFRLGDTTDPARGKGAQLAIQQINNVGRLNEGRPIAMVVCDNGGTDNALLDDERRQRNFEVVDYLAGTLGVPFIVGPVTSSDSLQAIGRIVSHGYPTVMISPSATSPQLTSEPDRLASSDPFGLFWRTAPSDVLQGAVLAADVVGKLPFAAPLVDEVAVVFLSDAYGQGLANVFQEPWGAQRTTLYPFDETDDLVALAGTVAAANPAPDAILMIAIDASRTLNFIRGMAGSGLETKFLYLTDGSKDEVQLLNPDLATMEPAVWNIIVGDCTALDTPVGCSPGLVGTTPAGPRGADFNLFAASLQAAFQIDPTGFSFVANSYDAAFVGAYGVVFASQDGSNWDGRTVASGLAHLTQGAAVTVGPDDWAAAKAGMTSGAKEIDITGISGPLDFDTDVGEAPAAMEVWDPTADCGGGEPCFAELATIDP
jgi:ABC-type branched-subunit amino acid transport system substrate-binding protein